MIRRVLPFVLIAIVFLMDTAIMPVLTNFWLIPVFGLILIHTLGLLTGSSAGLLYGMIMGLAVDITVSAPFGLMTVIYTLMGYTGGLFGHLLWRNRLAPVISSAVCFSLYEIIMDLYIIFSAMRFSNILFLRSACRVGVYVICVYLVQFPLGILIRPVRSRF